MNFLQETTQYTLANTVYTLIDTMSEYENTVTDQGASKKTDIETALNKLKTSGLAMLQLVFQHKPTHYPIRTAIRLVDVLAHPSIQVDDDLKFKVAQVCRLYSELLFQKAEIDGRKLRISTLARVLHQLKIVKSNIPKYRIGDQFEVKCIRLAYLLPMIEGRDGKVKAAGSLRAAKKLLKNHSEDIANMEDFKGGTIAGLGKTGYESIKLIKASRDSRWYIPARALHLKSQLWASHETPLTHLKDSLKNLYQMEHLSRHAALEALQTIHHLMNNTSDTKRFLILLEGSQEFSGLRSYLSFDHKSLKKTWKVRYLALQILLNQWSRQDLNEDAKIGIIDQIIKKLVSGDISKDVSRLILINIDRIAMLKKLKGLNKTALREKIESLKEDDILSEQTRLKKLQNKYNSDFGNKPVRQTKYLEDSSNEESETEFLQRREDWEASLKSQELEIQQSQEAVENIKVRNRYIAALKSSLATDEAKTE